MKKATVITWAGVSGLFVMAILWPAIGSVRGATSSKRSTQREMNMLKVGLALHVQEYGNLPESSLNAEILNALTGKNPRKLSFYSAPDYLVRDGQLMDDWGHPFLFEKVVGNMIIRSAGKDSAYHTKDDLTLDTLVHEPKASTADGR